MRFPITTNTPELEANIELLFSPGSTERQRVFLETDAQEADGALGALTGLGMLTGLGALTGEATLTGETALTASTGEIGLAISAVLTGEIGDTTSIATASSESPPVGTGA